MSHWQAAHLPFLLYLILFLLLSTLFEKLSTEALIHRTFNFLNLDFWEVIFIEFPFHILHHLLFSIVYLCHPWINLPVYLYGLWIDWGIFSYSFTCVDHSYHCIYLFIIFIELGFELRASHLQGKHSIACTIPPAHFAQIILKMGSCDLFSWSGLEL
jgi:hypothetical protein